LKRRGAKKYPEKCSNKRGTDQRPEVFWRLIKRSHSLYDTEHGRNDAKRRQAFGHGDERMIRFETIVTQGIDFIPAHLVPAQLQVIEVPRELGT
jgi:hypothetical protein